MAQEFQFKDYFRGSPLLNVDDPNFEKQLANAIGVDNLNEVNFVFPQFDRVDGKVISYIPTVSCIKEFDMIKLLNDETLEKIGCCKWEEKDGKVLWLYPYEWYDSLPNGHKIMDILWREEYFEYGITSDDRRCGMLAYGFVK